MTVPEAYIRAFQYPWSTVIMPPFMRIFYRDADSNSPF